MAKVTVKVAVSIDTSGDWNAYGGRDMQAEDAIEFSRETIGDQERTYWLTAELDIPETLVIQAAFEEVMREDRDVLLALSDTRNTR